jgi:ATP-binding cassette subfamily F protein 3
VKPFEGDLDEYSRYVLAGAPADGPSRPDAKESPGSRAEQRRAAAQMRIELAPVRRRIADAERTMELLSGKIARIDAQLAAPGLFARDPAKAAALSKARVEAVAALGGAENEWLAASAELEAAVASA